MPLLKKTISAKELVDDYLRTSGKVRFDDSLIEEELKNDNPSNKTLDAFDVIIICALPEERDRMFDAFDVSEEERKKTLQDFRSDFNIIYQTFYYSGLKIAVVTQNMMGMATAASLTTRAILAMNPRIVAMTGICAGRRNKVLLGDIIVADQVFDYTAGKKCIDRFSPRPSAFSTDEIIRNYITAEILDNDYICHSIIKNWTYVRLPNQIKIHMKSLASGSAVVDDNRTIDSVATVQDNLYAIDMESYGVALAATALRKRWIVIKAVQDYADGQKKFDEAGIRSFAAYASAALLKTIIPNIID